MSLYQFFQRWLAPSAPLILGLCTLSFLDQGASVLAIYVWKTIIDDYLLQIDSLTTEAFVQGIGLLILAWISLAMLSRVSKNVLAYKAKVMADRTSLDFFEQAYDHVMRLSLVFHEKRKTGEVLRQLSKARDDLFAIIDAFFTKVVMQVISFALVTAFFFVIQWQVAVVMLLYLPLFFAITWYFARNIDQVQDEINDELEKVHGSVQQALDSFLIVLSFHTQRHELNKMESNHHISHRCMKRKTIAFQKLGFWQGTLTNLARLSIITMGAYFVKMGSMTVGEVVLLSVWAFYIYNPMTQVSELYALFTEGINSIDRVEKLKMRKPAISNPPNPYEPEKIRGEIRFHEVSFRYPVHENKFIRDVSFHVHQGQSIAIVGPSGSGKSTITKLLPRFYDIEGGQIFIDGVDVREWDLGALRNTIGMVLQDTFLFNDTIYNNIVYGNPHVSREEVEHAAKMAHAHDFIMRLPNGYQSLVGERGIKLSGGEKQRLSIARTLLKDPSILILDEATSALDSESEAVVLETFRDICAYRTSITIAHRLSTIRYADLILFCEAGRIIERGNHDELMAQKGAYYRHVSLQNKDSLLEESTSSS